MEFHDELRALGVNVDEGLGRLCGKVEFYNKIIKKFPPEALKYNAMPYFEAGDKKGAFEMAHAMKGATGNLSLTPIYEGYCKIVEQLRAEDLEGAFETYKALLPRQEEIIDCINKHSS